MENGTRSVLSAYMTAWLIRPRAKVTLFVMLLLPFVFMVCAAGLDQLGANPAEALVRSTGDWTLRMLCAVLAVTPLRVMTNTPALARFRRMLGLFVYFYACLHLLSYSGFDMAFEPSDIALDIGKRPFILIGFTAWLLLSGLAFTSSNRIIKALGAKKWRRLHQLVYLIAPLALVHFFWMRAGKNDFAEVMTYAFVIFFLLVWRAYRFLYKNND
jgi:sulfoxide reductase heme-binding subunit YedZ